MSTVASKSAPLTIISKYRALMLICALEQGWTFSQTHTSVDQYRKGQDTVTLAWGGRSLVGYVHNNTEVVGQASMLQRAQGALGKPMELNKKWPALTPKKVKELEALATKAFKVKA